MTTMNLSDEALFLGDPAHPVPASVKPAFFDVSQVSKLRQERKRLRTESAMIRYRSLIRCQNTPETNREMMELMDTLEKEGEDVEKDQQIIARVESLLEEYEQSKRTIAAATAAGTKALEELNGLKNNYRHLFGPSSVVAKPPLPPAPAKPVVAAIKENG